MSHLQAFRNIYPYRLSNVYSFIYPSTRINLYLTFTLINTCKINFNFFMKPPEKPLPQDCCGTGCVRCVYDIYVEQLKEYKAWKKKQKVAEKSTE